MLKNEENQVPEVDLMDWIKQFNKPINLTRIYSKSHRQ